jgi:hypothetical protein
VNVCKECVQEILRSLEFVEEVKLRKDRDLEGVEGRTRSEVTLQKPNSEGKRCQVIWPEVFEKSEWIVEVLKGRVVKVPWAIRSCRSARKIKDECISITHKLRRSSGHWIQINESH